MPSCMQRSRSPTEAARTFVKVRDERRRGAHHQRRWKSACLTLLEVLINLLEQILTVQSPVSSLERTRARLRVAQDRHHLIKSNQLVVGRFEPVLPRLETGLQDIDSEAGEENWVSEEEEGEAGRLTGLWAPVQPSIPPSGFKPPEPPYPSPSYSADPPSASSIAIAAAIGGQSQGASIRVTSAGRDRLVAPRRVVSASSSSVTPKASGPSSSSTRASVDLSGVDPGLFVIPAGVREFLGPELEPRSQVPIYTGPKPLLILDYHQVLDRVRLPNGQSFWAQQRDLHPKVIRLCTSVSRFFEIWVVSYCCSEYFRKSVREHTHHHCFSRVILTDQRIGKGGKLDIVASQVSPNVVKGTWICDDSSEVVQEWRDAHFEGRCALPAGIIVPRKPKAEQV